MGDLGHKVECVADGHAGFDAAASGAARSGDPGLMLPGRDGIDVGVACGWTGTRPRC
ncbi:MAG: hypothetical protein R3E68_04610 [Burkholderiaceae bacterium]